MNCPSIDVSALTSKENYEYFADASDLGWPPGHFPPTVSVPASFGNGMPLVLKIRTEGKMIYMQEVGVLTLHVFND